MYIYWNYLNIKTLQNFVSFIESKLNAGKGRRVVGWQKKVRIVDVDSVTEPLAECDLNIVLDRVRAGGVGVVESVTSSMNSSSELHLPGFAFPLEICRYFP